MDNWMSPRSNGYPSFASSQRAVTYSCGSCGYDLNLNSSSRNTSTIGSKYGKSIKKGVLSFCYVDESRFTQVEELQCIPYFISRHSWGLFRRRTKLLCQKCGNHIGTTAYGNQVSSSYPLVTDGSESASGSETSNNNQRYDIRIRSLQPSTEEGIQSTVVQLTTRDHI
ncbi:uncharacterized protein At4g08330, chloroplastic-like [Impatiens glandulifera]|uniref:uncharacterized protein At4g08330, chloroplastic-like n=1 Tax=Impatiens glandulifera TaxID=253017 RepID=UPI001FB19548|nr:uncharacterized protein At4g08330, chloroplastic-like [Impatiens glandulifera]